MHRLLLEKMYEHGALEAHGEHNRGIEAILRERERLHAEPEASRPTSDLALTYYYDENPFLTEISSTLPSKMIVVPVLLKVDYGFTGLLSGRTILEYSLRAAVNEVMTASGELGRLIQLEDGNWLVLFHRDLKGDSPAVLIEDTEMDWAALEARCLALKERFRTFWRCGLAFFVGTPVPCRDLAAEYEILRARSREPRTETIQFITREAGGFQRPQARPDFEVWGLMLRGRDGHALIKEVTRFLIPANQPARNDPAFLRGFQQDLLQTVYAVTNEKNIPAHELLNEGRAADLWDRAFRSIDDLVAWFSYIVVKVCQQLEAESLGQSVVDRVRAFVTSNLDKELTRKTIAARLGLNPDYLARLFKKEKGLSILEFVQNERLAAARDLLARTDVPVSFVAQEVGYKNFSHFAQAFRNFTGFNPADFRRASPIRPA